MALNHLKQVGPYQLFERLGGGATSEVYRGVHQFTQRQVALKILRKNVPSKDRAAFLGEVQLARRLAGELFAGIVEHDLVGSMPWVAFDYVEGSSLFEWMKRDLTQVRLWAREVAVGLLHSLKRIADEGLTHRDVTPTNILLDERGRVRLVDFGLVTLKGTSGVAGTLAYLPPEALRGGPRTAASDVYQVGAVLYEILSGLVPHEDRGGSYLDYRRAQEQATPLLELATGVSPQVSHLVDSLLEPEAASRPNLDEALERAQKIPSPWAHCPPGVRLALSEELPGRRPRRQRSQAYLSPDFIPVENPRTTGPGPRSVLLFVLIASVALLISIWAPRWSEGSAPKSGDRSSRPAAPKPKS